MSGEFVASHALFRARSVSSWSPRAVYFALGRISRMTGSRSSFFPCRARRRHVSPSQRLASGAFPNTPSEQRPETYDLPLQSGRCAEREVGARPRLALKQRGERKDHC